MARTRKGHQTPQSRERADKQDGRHMRNILSILALAMLLAVQSLLFAVPVHAQEDGRGPVTGLPMPRFVSMKVDEGYARRGPSSTHRIDWVFQRRNMPLLLVDEYGQWRRVQDREGAGGWMHYSLLSGNRSVIVESNMVDLYRRPSAQAPVSARLQSGVVAWLGECQDEWCMIEAQGVEGWAPTTALWGVAPEDVGH
ncbi:MAG: SH3 domain-containing protein [Jannaschia helgolandensis]